MGNKSSSMLQDVEVKQLSDETGFSSTQIEKLHARFSHLDKTNCGSLNKFDLMSIPELAINPLCDRLIQLFFADCGEEDERINFRQFTRVLATFRSTNNASIPVLNFNQNGDNENTSMRNVTDEGKNAHSHNKRASPHQDSSQTTRGIAMTNDVNRIPVNGINDGLKNKLLFVFKVYDADNDGRISFNDLRLILKMMVGSYIEGVQLDKIASRAFVEADEDNDGYIEFQEFCKVFSGRDLNNKLRVKFFS